MRDKTYIKYANDVLSGKIIACQSIKLACKRFLSWFDRDDMYFDEEAFEKVMRFMSKLKHFEGKTAGLNFHPTACQEWMLAAIFGWKWKDTGFRVTNKVLIMVARKFGKSFFAAAIALYMLIADGEAAALVLNIANNRELAKLLFKMEQILCKQIDPSKHYLRVLRDRINFDYSNSYSRVLSTDSDGLDGLSASTFITDEIHAYKTSELWDVLISSQGFRALPLAIAITTAGFNLNGFLWNYYKTCKDILLGLKQDDTLFIAIYELDEGDDWQDESVWIKANPNLGVTVSKKYLKDLVLSALNNPSLEVGVKTKNLNMFCLSKTIWIPDLYVGLCSMDVDLDMLRSQETDDALICYGGVDIGAVSDLTSFSIVFPPSEERKFHPDKFIFKTWMLAPEVVFNESANSEMYKMWNKTHNLIITPGNISDLDYMIKILNEVRSKTTLFLIAYDPWSSMVWAQKCTDQDFMVMPFSLNMGHFSNPTKLFEMLVRSGKAIIDNNPITRWAISNTELREDVNQNVKPCKYEGSKSNKIDPVISMIEALGVWMETNGYMATQLITV